MKTKTIFAAAAVLLGGLILQGTFDWESAQGQRRGSGTSSSAGNPAAASGGGASGLIPGAGIGSGYSSGSLRRSKLRNAIKQLRAAKDAAAKDKATKAIAALLKEQFDADLKRREQDIANIEARVKELRSILEKRRAAQDSIVQLQIKVLVYEAEGLGFPSRASSGRRNTPFAPFGGVNRGSGGPLSSGAGSRR